MDLPFFGRLPNHVSSLRMEGVGRGVPSSLGCECPGLLGLLNDRLARSYLWVGLQESLQPLLEELLHHTVAFLGACFVLEDTHGGNDAVAGVDYVIRGETIQTAEIRDKLLLTPPRQLLHGPHAPRTGAQLVASYRRVHRSLLLFFSSPS